MHLHGRRSSVAGALPPDHIDDAVHGHDPIRLGGEDRQDGPWPRSAEVERDTADPNLQGSEDQYLHAGVRRLAT
ncbi:MAG: hypothetical protein Q8K58_08765 [Acidimicrobiales bacterium]|nr:hypothetical protein [Acidimicrobiales bacterium]